jgi:hypothetical protein
MWVDGYVGMSVSRYENKKETSGRKKNKRKE